MAETAQNMDLKLNNTLYTVEQVKEILGVSRQTIWRFRNREENPLKAIPMGNSIRFRPSDVEDFIQILAQEKA